MKCNDDDSNGLAKLVSAATKVVSAALDSVDVHPCDVHDDNIRANGLSAEMAALYVALKELPCDSKNPPLFPRPGPLYHVAIAAYTAQETVPKAVILDA